MNDLLQPSIQDVNERMCGNCDALVCAGCPVYEMDKLAALRARVEATEHRLTFENIKAIMTEIEEKEDDGWDAWCKLSDILNAHAAALAKGAK